MSRAHLSGVVLAGGSGLRMGQDKALLRLDGVTLLSRAVGVLAHVADEVVVVGRDALPRDTTYAACLPDETLGDGPLGGLLTGLCRARHEWIVVAAVDLPFLTAPLLDALAELRGEAQAVIPLIQGRPQPLCGLYHRSAARAIKTQLRAGDRRMSSLVDTLHTRWVPGEELREYDPDLLSFTNVNTVEEWEKVLGVGGVE